MSLVYAMNSIVDMADTWITPDVVKNSFEYSPTTYAMKAINNLCNESYKQLIEWKL